MDLLISLSQSAKGHFPNFKMKVMEMKKNLKRWRGFELGMRGVGFVEWNSRPHRHRSRLRHLDVHFGLLLVVQRSPLYSGSLRLLNIGDAP